MQYYFQCPVTVLGLASGNVTNGWFLQTPRVRVVTDKMDDVVNVGGAQVILPTSLVQQPPEHAATAGSLASYYYATPYAEMLGFSDENFLSDAYLELLLENQIKLEDNASFYILVRIGARLVALYFTE